MVLGLLYSDHDLAETHSSVFAAMMFADLSHSEKEVLGIIGKSIIIIILDQLGIPTGQRTNATREGQDSAECHPNSVAHLPNNYSKLETEACFVPLSRLH